MLLKTIKYLLVLLIVGMVAPSCARKSISNATLDRYEGEIKNVRPRYTYVEPAVEKAPRKDPQKKEPERYRPTKTDQPLYVTKRLEAVLDTISSQNKSIRYISGFRVQLYVGNARQEAEAAKAYVYQMFPELNPYVSFSQPTYRVKAGDFMYRTDADDYLAQIRQQYSAAVVLPERVEIKKGLAIRASGGLPKY